MAIASVFFLLLTLLFLDFTGSIHLWFGWLAKTQLVAAVLAANTVAVAMLAVLTLLFGRVYCSVICPLGVYQDCISNISGRRRGKRRRFRFSAPKSWLRFGVLGVFIIAFFAGVNAVVSLLDPYAAYGRIAAELLAPLYRSANNLLASIAERAGSYVFYSTEVWVKAWTTLAVGAITLLLTGVLAWRHGRTYCNTICPVGTFLGIISRFSLFRMTINEEKCTKCMACERGCKSSCIDTKNMRIDHSRCVNCFDCIGKCRSGAMKYAAVKPGRKKVATTAVAVSKDEDKPGSVSRRNVLSVLGMLAVTQTIRSQQLHVDGGLADIEDKQMPERKTRVVPPGALSVQNMKDHCTACQLCVSSCPNGVLRPSNKLSTFMQPEMSFEKGYCRPECVECSQVCPTGAIKPISTADKSASAIGLAVWIKENCVVSVDGVQCNNCEHHCPTGAIVMVAHDAGYSDSLKIPVVDKELCIGCGACEYLCPARPFSAMYIEGNARHHSV